MGNIVRPLDVRMNLDFEFWINELKILIMTWRLDTKEICKMVREHAFHYNRWIKRQVWEVMIKYNSEFELG